MSPRVARKVSVGPPPRTVAFARYSCRGDVPVPLLLPLLEQRPDRDQAMALLAEGFDMLEEDLEKERFFAFARRTFWASPQDSPRRALMQTLIGKLDF